MARFYCFPSLLVGKKKKVKEPLKTLDGGNSIKHVASQVKLEKLIKPSDAKVKNTTSYSEVVPLKSYEPSSADGLKEKGNDCSGVVEAAYEGGCEHDVNSTPGGDCSDPDMECQSKIKGDPIISKADLSYNDFKNSGSGEMVIRNELGNDHGMECDSAFQGLPRLKRSCSNIERRVTIQLSPSKKSFSYGDLKAMSGRANGGVPLPIQSSPVSVISSRSADKIILKKRSSSQVLPSRSRKIWWKLFLWSHRNLHNAFVSKPKMFPGNESANKRGGYSSDTLEPDRSSKKQLNKFDENQWVAFSMETSPLARVNAWVNTLDDNPEIQLDNSENEDDIERPDVGCLTSFEVGESSKKNHVRSGRHVPEEVIQANNIIQSMNSLSSGAHICGMGLKVLPAISAFTSLRSVNLSNNFIVHITPGALPKSLQTLDLSRNKITTIDGLRELTRLRVLNLSYNKISRIGHGLSSSTLIKELYLAGNKISNVEGLHRLLKLSLLDLSFNKINTTKSLGQLVANYNSLLALNLLGNPVQTTIGDDQLRKVVSGLLPHLMYLNKQPIKPQRAREAATDSIARAALGDDRRSSRRRAARRVTQGSGLSSRGRVGEGSTSRSGSGSRHRSKSKGKHQ